MRFGKRRLATAIGCVAAAALLGCDDGTTPVPSVSLTSDATTVALGQRVTLTWTSRHASGCTAEGAWSGSKAANGIEPVPVPLNQTRNAFALVCSRDGKSARAEVVVAIRPPRFSLQTLPLSVAIDLNDDGDVLGHDHGNEGDVPDYERYEDDPVVWTTTGVLRIATPCPMACPPELPLCREGCPPNYTMTLAALNNHRTVLAGEYWHASSGRSRLIALGGQPLPSSLAPIERPTALNDAAQVAGCCTSLGIPPPYLNKALLFSGGQLTVVQPPGSDSGAATAINEAGLVAGYYATTAGGPVHVFRYENGLAADLGTLPDGVGPEPRGINAAGTIIGTVELASGGMRAFRSRGATGTLEILPGLGGAQSSASGLDDREQVVGSSTLAGAPDSWRATLLSAGTLYDLNDLVVDAAGIVLERSIDINAAGQVLGVGCDATREDCRPYLLTPVDPR